MPALHTEAHSSAVVRDKHFKLDILGFTGFFFFKLEGTFRSVLRQERRSRHQENSLEQLMDFRKPSS